MIHALSSWWTLGGVMLALGGFGVFLMTPFGVPVLAVLRAFLDTRLGQWLVAAGAALLALMAALARARQIGRDEARAAQEQANAQAVRDQQAIARQVDDMSDDALRKELGEWSK